MRIRIFWSMGLLMSIVGCGGGLPLAPVTGVVTLDGQPLENATVTFLPIAGEGSTSIGETGPDGKFVLSYTREKHGALIGKHRVRINTSKITTHSSGIESHIGERIPDRYNVATELEYEVKSGSNASEFKLRSGGTISTVTDPAFAPQATNRTAC